VDDLVVLGACAFEEHGLAEAYSIFAGSGKGRRYGVMGTYGAPTSLPERVELAITVGMASPPPTNAERDDGRFRLHREAHEARAEVHQGVALVVELRGAARALGEHHEQAVVFEEPLGVLGQPGELPRARDHSDAKGTG
jgi:hypothetical protein